MLTFSNLSEALVELKSQTGKDWTDSELFDCAVTNGLELHATPPIDARITASEWVLGRGHVSATRDRWHLAVLNPAQVGQLWMAGETTTDVPLIPDKPDVLWCQFSEPVRVTRTEVRIQDRTIRRVVELYLHACGEAESNAAGQVVLTAAEAAGETTKERRHRLLQWRDEEVNLRGKRGANARTVSRERERGLRPTADQSNISKEIKKALLERADEMQARTPFCGQPSKRGGPTSN